MNNFEKSLIPDQQPKISQVDVVEYQRKLSQGVKEQGFGFYEAAMEFRKELLREFSEDELRQSALYHVLIGSTPETEHNHQIDNPINRQIMTYLDQRSEELAEAKK